MSIDVRFLVERGNFTLDVECALPAQGVTAVFGRSGCGKTTFLRCLAGLERHPNNRLRLGGETWQDAARFVPTHQRQLGYVFQESSLFPHLTVAANLRYGWQRVPVAQRRVDFDETVVLLGLEALLARYPDALSGGQRQRVAIGRALLTSPRLLLMDEPLGALDDTSKRDILPWLEQLPSALDMPVIYVSHSIDEVARLADSMVLLEQGRLLAQGPLSEILTRTDLPLAHGESASAVIEAQVVQHDAHYHLTTLAWHQTRLVTSRLALSVGHVVRVRIRARDVALTLVPPQAISTLNCLAAQVVAISDDPHPGHVLVNLDVDGQVLLSRITRHSRDQLGLVSGMAVYALVKGIVIR